jgi:hypothetical protein
MQYGLIANRKLSLLSDQELIYFPFLWSRFNRLFS